MPVSRRKLFTIGACAIAAAIGGWGLFRHFSATSPVKVESFITAGDGKKKNILVLAGSARENGNTVEMAKAFARGARESGHESHIFNAGAKQMSDCLHCDLCWSDGRPCVVDDSFYEMAPLLEQADMLVFCSPLYWYNFSGSIKCALDRLYPWSRENRPADLKIKETMLLMCGESFLPRSFAGPADAYRQMLGYKGWKDRGRLFATGINKLGAFRESRFMKIAEEMGRKA